MITNKQIALDPTKFIRTERIVIRGGQVEVSVSPYDIPERVSSDYNNSTHQFAIHFQYPVEDEPLEEIQAHKVILRVGKHSQRLCGIVLDTSGLAQRSNELKGLVKAAVAELTNRKSRERTETRDNYRIAEEVIDEQGSELFSAFVAG